MFRGQHVLLDQILQENNMLEKDTPNGRLSWHPQSLYLVLSQISSKPSKVFQDSRAEIPSQLWLHQRHQCLSRPHHIRNTQRQII